MSPDKQRDTIHNRDVHPRLIRQATNHENARDENARDKNARDKNARDKNARDENARDENARDENARDVSVNSHMPESIGTNHCAPGNDTRKIRVGSLRAMPKWRYIELSEIGSTCS